MFTNVAYLYNSPDDTVDNSRSLVVTSCGYYRMHSLPVMATGALRAERTTSYCTLLRARRIFTSTEHTPL